MQPFQKLLSKLTTLRPEMQEIFELLATYPSYLLRDFILEPNFYRYWVNTDLLLAICCTSVYLFVLQLPLTLH